MPVVASDIVYYAAANKPEDDTSLNGGAIDVLERVIFSPLAANDTLEVVSSDPGDTTQSIQAWSRLATGARVNESVGLNGTTPVAFATMGNVARVLRGLIDADCAGDVTVRRQGDAGDIAVIPAGERGFRRLFIDASAEAAGGSQKLYHEKIFARNAHDTLALLNAVVSENADPTGLVNFLIAAAKGDSATSTNRLTAPGAADTLDPDTFDGTDKAVPGTNLGAAEAIGIWVRMTLAAGATPVNNTWSVALVGTSA